MKPQFDFPSKKEAEGQLIEHINRIKDWEESVPSRILIGLDLIGREEILVKIAEVFGTLIMVDEKRYEQIQKMGLDIELFTTNLEEAPM